MLHVPRQLLTLLVALVLLGGAARVHADPIFEPNNTKATPTILNSGQWSINDNLSANSGRPDTLLGHYDAAYSALLDSDDNGSTLGDGFASRLVDVPLNANGSAYFRVTGAGDISFIGAHSQVGQYYAQFDLYDSNHLFFKTLALEFESVAAGFLDNLWVDPPAVPEPERAGGFVTVTIQNIVGPGTGDSVDFFLFSGLEPNEEFTAVVSSADFAVRLGWFGGPSNTLLASSEGVTPTIVGTADGLGRALLAVTGAGDTQFLGAHSEVGDYTLSVVPVVVPEPTTLAMLAMAAPLAVLLWRRQQRQVRAACRQ
jgi:hypothetical protein